MRLKEIAGEFIAQNNSDLYLFNASIIDESVDKLLLHIRDKEERKEKCSLILTTSGGDPDAGYRLVRTLKRYYKNEFVIYVFGTCKSTGTLVALGATEIVMSDFGEFGPLDIQLTKDDELINTSGLSYFQTVSFLGEWVFKFFEDSFIKLKTGSGNTITTKTAAEIASKLSIGLFSPLSTQMDPLRLGEVNRAMKIADDYGSRLCSHHNEDLSDLISSLIANYPSHDFVIDFDEAKEIFPNVRWVNDLEKKLERELFEQNFVRKEGRASIIADLGDDLFPRNTDSDNDGSQSEDREENNNENSAPIKKIKINHGGDNG